MTRVYFVSVDEAKLAGYKPDSHNPHRTLEIALRQIVLTKLAEESIKQQFMFTDIQMISAGTKYQVTVELKNV